MTAKVLCIAGARPNFMKVAPLLRAFRACSRFEAKLVHTGQHYDPKLSDVFFRDLGIADPDTHLEVGSGSHAAQTAEIMRRFEPVLDNEQAQVVLVVGDVNSTVACALVATKFVLARPFWTRWGRRRRPLVVHVEAGLRSFDDDMPEEVNRRLTDAASDLLYVSEPAGLANLEREGVSKDRTVLVGNVMIDTLLAAREQAESSRILDELAIQPGGYGVVTLHRPSNVDEPTAIQALLGVLGEIADELPLVFPVHPRTALRLDEIGLRLEAPRWRVIEPVGYLDFLRLLSCAKVVLTDSGGIQEETTVLGVPCITLRENTERPATIETGTNQLAGTDRSRVLAAFERVRAGKVGGRVPPLWDGRAAARIVEHLHLSSPKRKVMASPLASEAAPHRTPRDRTRVYLTVDTECAEERLVRGRAQAAMGYDLRVFGRLSNQRQPLGIELIMDEWEAFGHRATFFVEPLGARSFGTEGLREACERIRARGHDIGLHVHPRQERAFWYSKGEAPLPDDMSAYSRSDQGRLIDRGLCLLQEVGVPRDAVVSCRAGNFGANNDTWGAMADCGLLVSSNLNPGYRHKCRIESARLGPGLFLTDAGVWELPMGVFRQLGGAFRHMQLRSVSSLEMVHVLGECWRTGVSDVVLLTHSFEFLHIDSIPAARGRLNSVTLGRLRRLARFLRDSPDRFETLTVGQLGGRIRGPGLPQRPPSVPPRGSLLGFAIRLAVQAYQRLQRRLPLP